MAEKQEQKNREEVGGMGRVQEVSFQRSTGISNRATSDVISLECD
jgi:hypothetical protein